MNSLVGWLVEICKFQELHSMMENSAKKCEIGQKLNESCELTEHSDYYVLNKEEIEILELRTQCSPLTKVCQGHRKVFLTQYANHQRACCDP